MDLEDQDKQTLEKIQPGKNQQTYNDKKKINKRKPLNQPTHR